MIRCVVFDFDGVLVQSNAAKRRAYFDIFAATAGTAPLVERALRECRGSNRYQVIGHVLEQLRAAGRGPGGQAGAAAIQHYAALYNRITEDHASTCPEVPGAAQTLHSLAARLPLYVNSATPGEPLGRIVERRGWREYFRGVLGGPQSKLENLNEILARERLGPDEVLFLGDTQGDWEAAARCGCRFCAVRSDGNDFDGTPPALLDDLTTLEAALQRRNGIEPC